MSERGTKETEMSLTEEGAMEVSRRWLEQVRLVPDRYLRSLTVLILSLRPDHDLSGHIPVKVEVLEQAIAGLTHSQWRDHKRNPVACDGCADAMEAESALRAAVQGSGEGGKRP